jgi:hypothetical protein
MALTPSARLIKEIGETDESFFDLALRTSAAHKAYFLDQHEPNKARLNEFADQAAESLEVAEAMASAPQKDFDVFIADYFS